MSKLLWDPRPRATRKPPASTASTSEPKSAAAQLLLRRGGGRAAAKDESIELFSALRKCQPDPRVSGQPQRDGRRGGGGGGGDDELLSTVIGKHDYDWLLTPPETPLWSPATSAAGRQVSAAVPDRLARSRSASYAKSNSRLSLTRRDRESGNPTSRLARSSSATRPSVNTPAIASSARPSHVRTLSSASSSSINTASNASVSSTPLGSAATSPLTPATARSGAASALPHRRDNVQPRQFPAYTAGKTKATASSNSGPSTPTSARPRASTCASSPRSTSIAATQQAAPTRRGANALARSRFASQSTAGSTVQQDASPAPQGVRSNSKPRPKPAAAEQHHGNGLAAVSTTTLRWQPSSAVAVNQSVPRGVLAASRSSRNGDGGRKISVEKATHHRTSGLASAAVSCGVRRNGSRKSASSDAKRTVNEHDGCRYQDARHGAAPPAQQRIFRSVGSRSRLGFMTAASDVGSTARGRSTAAKEGELTAAAAGAARVAVPDAFPSTRYDAMLLREDPKNLTWLLGYSGDDDVGGGAGFVEPFDLPGGLGGTRYH